MEYYEAFHDRIKALLGLARGEASLSRMNITRTTACVVVVLAVVAYSVTSRLRTWYRLRHIPGPFWCGFSSLWLLRESWHGTLYASLGKMAKTYGPIFRVAPGYVVVADPYEIRRMWAVRSEWDRGIWWKGFQLDPPNDATISLRDAEKHNLLRSKLAAGYSGKGVVGLHDSIDEGVARFIRLIEDKYLSDETHYRPADMARKVQYLTLDVISKIAFGKTFGFIDADDDCFGYIKTTEETMPLMQIICLIPALVSLLQSPLCKALLPSHKDTTGLGRIMGIAKQTVAKRFGPDKLVQQDMLGSFIKNGLSQREAEAESLVQIIAGSDTTASTLRAALLHLSTSPVTLRRLLHEIDSGIASGTISSPITDAEARNLPYLQAVIRETLRLWPPITSLMAREDLSPGRRDSVVLGDIKIPKGTAVCWSAWAVMHSKDVFGEDADVYSPDRWLPRDAAGPGRERERLRTMDQIVDLCFGAGKWQCLGRPIAMIELNKAIVELFRRFDFTVVNPTDPMKSGCWGITISTDLWMRITRREGVPPRAL